MKNTSSKGLIIFDHDGTLVNTETPNFKLFLGIKELVFDLYAAGFELAIWTARPHASVVTSLKALEISQYFGNIYGSGDGPIKPHPTGLKEISAEYLKSQIIHIGDSLSDIEGAHAFGIEVIAASWYNTVQIEVFKLKTPYVALTVKDCRAMIAKKFGVHL